MSYNKELVVDPEYIAMCQRATEFQRRFKARLDIGRYFRWWDTRHNEARHQVIKEQEEINTFREFDPEFIALPMIDQLLGFTMEPLESIALLVKAVNAEKKHPEKYYTKISSLEKRLLALIMWESESLTWSGQSWEKLK